MKDDLDFAAQVAAIQEQAKEVRLDDAEDVVDVELKKGDKRFEAAKYILDNQGQSRGYGKRGVRIAINQQTGVIMGNYPDDPSTPESWDKMAKVHKVEQAKVEGGGED